MTASDRQCGAATRSGQRCRRRGRPLCDFHSGAQDARRERYGAAARDSKAVVEMRATSLRAVGPDSELGRAMARACERWGEAGPPDPAEYDKGTLRATPVEDA